MPNKLLSEVVDSFPQGWVSELEQAAWFVHRYGPNTRITLRAKVVCRVLGCRVPDYAKSDSSMFTCCADGRVEHGTRLAFGTGGEHVINECLHYVSEPRLRVHDNVHWIMFHGHIRRRIKEEGREAISDESMNGYSSVNRFGIKIAESYPEFFALAPSVEEVPHFASWQKGARWWYDYRLSDQGIALRETLAVEGPYMLKVDTPSVKVYYAEEVEVAGQMRQGVIRVDGIYRDKQTGSTRWGTKIERWPGCTKAER
jgi:hypothetical protein